MSRALIAAMLAVVLSVAVSALYARYRLSNAIEIFNISMNAAPSIEQLAIARSHLRRCDYAIAEALAVDGRAVPVARVADEQRAFHDAVTAYLRLPDFPGERQGQQRLVADVAAVDRALAATTALVAAGRTAEVRRVVRDELDPAVQSTDEELAQLVGLNGRHLAEDAAAIRRTERYHDRFVYLLFGCSFVLAAGATLLVIRVVRRYFAVVDRRARELEYFAIQIGHDVLNPLTPIATALRTAEQAGDGVAIERGLRGVDRIQRSVAGLLAFARADERSPPTATADVRRCLDDVLADLSAGGRVVVAPMAEAQVRCAAPVLQRVLRAMLAEALARCDGGEARVHVEADKTRRRIVVIAGAAGSPLGDRFAPRIRGVDSGYPGIELEMLTARRLVETHDGRVGTRADGGRCVTFAELPAA